MALGFVLLEEEELNRGRTIGLSAMITITVMSFVVHKFAFHVGNFLRPKCMCMRMTGGITTTSDAKMPRNYLLNPTINVELLLFASQRPFQVCNSISNSCYEAM